ncbi:hypothetical protein ACHAXS_004677 [Conticribra weissflogii]
MVPKQFCSVLIGPKLFIYTDNKNLTFTNLNCGHILCWQSFVDEYGPTILYHPGKKNVIADTFSQFPYYTKSPLSVGEICLLFF